jgi:hypothetical protein
MMHQLGSLGRDRTKIGSLARLLVRKNLAARTDAPLIAGVRRLPHLYWLTHRGAATLNELDGREGELAALGADRRFGTENEVLHRIGVVELHMAARAWCERAGVALDGFTLDFEPGSHGRHKATTIAGKGYRFTPDALAWVRSAEVNAPRLLVIELERGGQRGDLSKFFREKLPHLRALAEGGYLDRHPGLPAELAFLIVFGSHAKRKDGTPRLLHREALGAWPDPAARVWDRFFIKSQDEAAADFGAGWWQPGGRPQRDLFPEGATHTA